MEKVYSSEKLNIYCEQLGMLGNNVFVLESESEKALVDPACNTDQILDMAENKLDKILLTHYHWDHIRALAEVQAATGAKTFASEKDAPFIEDTEKAPLYRKTDSCKIDTKLKDGETVPIGSTTWKVIETPGHTPGSICFYSKDCGDKPVLICGDVLFRCSCGRTDFPDGNELDMRNSLAKLAELPDNTLVLPGHDQLTTIEHERNFMLQ